MALKPTRWTVDMALRRIILSAFVMAVSTACAPRSACNNFPGGSDWAVSLTSPSGARLEGTVTSESQFVGQRVSAEGAGEPMSYPLNELSLGGNRLHIAFGPARIQIDGQCHGRDSVAARYVFRDEAGAGTLIRKSR